MSDSKQSNDKLRSSLLSYSFVQKNLHENLYELQKFLQASGIGTVDINELRENVDRIKAEEEKIKHQQEMIAKLFTQDKKARLFRFGSSFCPKCSMFKNYEKECPFCKHLEMTL